jgi:hypothetical protein
MFEGGDLTLYIDVQKIADYLTNQDHWIEPIKVKDGSTVIPKTKGVYAWFSNQDHSMVYIGLAAGKKGLFNRIVRHHLNPKSLETREEKIRDKDWYQVENPIYVDGKIAIDKSAFRKNVARYHKLRAGEESVNFLINNFKLNYYELDDLTKQQINEVEDEMIKIFKPFYNKNKKDEL